MCIRDRVGTDGVLLGAWADVVSARNILDIGTGTGSVSYTHLDVYKRQVKTGNSD